MKIAYTANNTSILSFLNFMILRIKNGYPISEFEKRDSYRIYEEYCKEQGLDYFAAPVFWGELKKRGVEAKKIWSSSLRKYVKIRDLSLESMEAALGRWVDNSVSHAAIMEIGQDKYRIVIKLTKLNPADQSAGEELSIKLE